jgi:hypothetical protein
VLQLPDVHDVQLWTASKSRLKSALSRAILCSSSTVGGSCVAPEGCSLLVMILDAFRAELRIGPVSARPELLSPRLA